MKNKNLSFSLLIILAYTPLTGFIDSDPEAEVAQFIRETESKVQPSKNLDLGPLPKIKKYEPYIFSQNVIDPFALKDFVLDKSAPTTEADADHCKDEQCGDGPPLPHPPYFLERFDNTELLMVGTILDEDGSRKALIRTPQSGIVRASKGEYMGKNNGLIVEIDEDHVVIQEKHKVPFGWQNRMATLELFQ